MANYNTLKTAIQEVVKTNGNNEITGALLQQCLLAMVNSLGAGYQYMGIANPSTNPGTPDQSVFYVAATAGTYTNFGGIVLSIGELCILKGTGTTWTKDITGAATSEQIQNEIPTRVLGQNPHSIFWDFYFRLQAGKEYKILLTSGDVGKICVGQEVGSTLVLGEWVSYTPSVTGDCYYLVSDGATNTPIIFIADSGSSIQELTDFLQSEIVIVDGKIFAINSRIDSIDASVSGITIPRSINVVSGTSSLSQTNIYNGNALPADSYIKIKIVHAEGLISKIRFVNQNWSDVYPTSGGHYADFSDGQELIIKLSVDTTKIGMYIESNYVVGTGTVQLEIITNYQNTLEYLRTETIPEIQNEIDEINREIDNLPIAQAILFDMSNRKGSASLLFSNAIDSVRVWGLKKDCVFGISLVGNFGETQKQLFFNVYDTEGVAHGCYVNLPNSSFKESGDSYITLYRDNLSFYPAYSDTNILPSEIRFTIDISKLGTLPIGSYDPAVSFLPFSVRVCNEFPNPYTILGDGTEKVYITCKRYGTSGVDADFCGLNAIGDAVDSIVDASPSKEYFILIDGHFLFTNPKMVSDGGDFKYLSGGEPTALIAGKKWVNFIGVDKDKAIIEVNFDGNLSVSDFPSGLTFTDYQPVYIRQGCTIKNITFIGKNVRYTAHIEVGGGGENGCNINIEDCRIIRKLDTQGYRSCLVIGEIPYFTLSIKNSDFVNENQGTIFGGHTPLNYITNGRENCNVEFSECNFMSPGGISLATYNYNRKDVHVFKNCTFSRGVIIGKTANATSKRDIGTLVEQRFNTLPQPFIINPATTCGLRITATDGNPSSVRFDKNCSAFGIVGNANDDAERQMENSAIKKYGYEYKDGPNGPGGYACGWVNVDPTTGNSLGSILGDCSATPKTLTIVINGTQYNVVFNTNLTSETNANIIALINNVINSVAVCDLYAVETQEYPMFENVEYYQSNGDSNTIQRGMGVVKIGTNTIRRAKQADGYIDGIAVDTMLPGQSGRIICGGLLYNRSASTDGTPLSIYPVLSINTGTKISIDPENDGQFIVSNDVPVLKGLGGNLVEIIR